MVQISQLTSADEKALADINQLISQLRRNPKEHHGTLAELSEVTADPTIFLLVAKDGGRIVGMAMLYTLMKIGKCSGTVEDVVVHSDYRGQGLGKQLMQEILRIAQEKGLQQLYLTSRPDPDRTAAQKLYEGIGFKREETDVFKLTF